MMSPVWFFICHSKGSLSIWENRVSLMVLARVSEPLVLLTLNMYCDTAFTAATAIIASDMIHRSCLSL